MTFVADGTSDGVEIVPAADLSGKTNSTVSCKIVTSDPQGVIFSTNSSAAYLGAFVSTSAAALSANSGTPAYTVDASPVVDRDELFDAIVDGVEHELVISAIDFTAGDWTSTGLFLGGFGSPWNLEATVTDFQLDGVAYSKAPPEILGGSELSVGLGISL